MSIRIQYAYLKEQTWLYRRNYPLDIRNLLGVPALKQSLKTGDPKVAKARIAELNATFESVVAKARQGVVDLPPRAPRQKVARTIGGGAKPSAVEATIADLSRAYLNKRSDELRHGGFKSVRFSVGLFASFFAQRSLRSLGRDDGRLFLRHVAELSPHVGKSERARGLGLVALADLSKDQPLRITPQTQRRIFSQVCHFIDWAIYEGFAEGSPFQTVRVEQKSRPTSYAVPSEEEVMKLLQSDQDELLELVRFCLLTGMRAGEAAGLLREDLVHKGELGWFAQVRPNSIRLLKTGAAERVVPLHSALQARLATYPAEGMLFPDLSVPKVTKRFAKRVKALGIGRPGLVFHSTRKWFITQCERAGVPEHFTATLVGHQSARSENRMTYSIYSAGISDEQKREIVEKVRLPCPR